MLTYFGSNNGICRHNRFTSGVYNEYCTVFNTQENDLGYLGRFSRRGEGKSKREGKKGGEIWKGKGKMKKGKKGKEKGGESRKSRKRENGKKGKWKKGEKGKREKGKKGKSSE